MDKITLKNYRCFREKQTIRLAPLTLLVGENSTGKTSFMAMIRALWAQVPKSDILESQLATSLEGRDEKANKQRNHIGMVPRTSPRS